MKYFFLSCISRVIPKKAIISVYFFLKHRYRMSWDNPRTFSQKLQIIKLKLGRSDAKFADKADVRSFVEDEIGARYLIELLGLYKENNIEKVKNHIEDHVVIKTTHGSGASHIEICPTDLSWEEIRAKFKRALKERYVGTFLGEEHYDFIEPQLIVERKIGERSESPVDYKFHVFRKGKEINWVLQIDWDRFSQHKRNFYDSELNLLNVEVTYPNGNFTLPSEEKLSEMLSIAQRLSESFIYARIDLYLIENCIYFGEITLSSGSGFEKIVPHDFDLLLGSYLPSLTTEG
ncbi:ATP-grasp fold amidoligase family protein [Idiomarina abyssalis]|uniref:ATP-grasp fold amidoligase family protein n=1 Tax=Idiomarina abyssalis TaxID=86102 RepID=UPI003A8DC382